MNLPYLAPVNRYGKEYTSYAEFFREHAMAVDAAPDSILDYCDHPAIQFLLNDRNSTVYERTEYLEALSYGDPGVVLASPILGASLSGLMLKELGTEDQIERFYNYIQKNSARTFFALTEPMKGSDAGSLQSQLTPHETLKEQYYLNGEKCLFGNGAVGKAGVILARVHPGSLGIRAVYITPDLLSSNKNWIQRENLPMTGLRGAQIAYMRFNNCPITQEHLLGNHLRPMQRGMMAVIKTFNRLRTGVGALAIGQAQAVLDYFYENKKEWDRSDKKIYLNLYYKLDMVRKLLSESAKRVDLDVYDSVGISIAKVQATKVAEEVVKTTISRLDAFVLLENQWLAKCYRDCFAWEYMEGTKNMQLKNIFQNHVTK